MLGKSAAYFNCSQALYAATICIYYLQSKADGISSAAEVTGTTIFNLSLERLFEKLPCSASP